MAALIISNKEMENIIKIVKSLEESGLLIKGVSESVKNEVKEQRGRFIGMLLSILAASKLEIMLAEKSKTRGRRVIRAGEEIVWADKGAIATSQGRDTIRAGDDFKCLLIL